MQSLGNYFVIIDLEQISFRHAFSADFFQKISDRNFGVGCDLVVLYKIVDFRSSSILKRKFAAILLLYWFINIFFKNEDNCTMIADEKLLKINTKNRDDISIYWNNEITINSFEISRISYLI